MIIKTLVITAVNIAFNIGNYFLWTHLAYMNRGYHAVGGEWILILGLGVAFICFSIKVGKPIKENSYAKRTR